MDTISTALSLLPFLVFCFFLIFKKTSLLLISILTALITLLISLFYWFTPLSVVLISSIKGTLVALDIFFIIFGAIFFLGIIQEARILEGITYYLEKVSTDYRIQVILLAWFFENFLEGVAGFGTPSTVVAPILIAFGIPPLTSVIITLLGNSSSVAFGAAGTPIRVGLAETALNFTTVGITTALINCVGFLIPSFMLWVLVANKKDKFQLFFEALPFSIFAGIAFTLPALAISFLGIEFPSIIGSVAGLLLVILTIKFGFFPLSTPFEKPVKNSASIRIPGFRSIIFPYTLLIILLITGKFLFSSLTINISSLGYTLNVFNPGFIFAIASFSTFIYLKIKKEVLFSSISNAFKKSLEPFAITAAMSVMVQLMNNSSANPRGFPSITHTIAGLFETKFLPAISPFMGAFGSFITGSATVSNLMFAAPLELSSLALHMDPVVIISLALVGASAGNMIAIADVVAAITVAGIKNEIRKVIKGIVVYCLIYILLISIIGIFIT